MAARRLSPALLGIVATAAVLTCFSDATSCAAEGQSTLAQLAKKVDPAIVTIEVPGVRQGSGFVLDEKGTIVTNYHVIEGAKEAKVVFHDKTEAKIEGFVGISPGKDLAILRIKAATAKLRSLDLAQKRPSKGDKVYAFGAPWGLTGSVSDGIVSAVRNGADVRDILRKTAGKDVYTEALQYDLDAIWIQTTAPVSSGNSGGPLVNREGKVVGVNTWRQPFGQSLNFAVSAHHIRQLLENSGEASRSLADLPKPRSGVRRVGMADGKRTLEYWNQRGKIEGEVLTPAQKRGGDSAISDAIGPTLED